MSVYQAATRFFCHIETYRQPDILVSVHLCAKIKCYQHSLPSYILSHAWKSWVISFLFFYFGEQSFLWGCWYPCFGLLVMSAMVFKAREDPLLACFRLQWIPRIQLWCDTCWPFGGQHGSPAVFHPRTCTQALVEVEPESLFIPLPSKKTTTFHIILSSLALLWLTLQKYQTIYFKMLEETRFFLTHRFIITTLIGWFIVSLSVMVLPHSKQLGKASRQFCFKGNKFITQITCRLQDPGSKWIYINSAITHEPVGTIEAIFPSFRVVYSGIGNFSEWQ